MTKLRALSNVWSHATTQAGKPEEDTGTQRSHAPPPTTGARLDGTIVLLPSTRWLIDRRNFTPLPALVVDCHSLTPRRSATIVFEEIISLPRTVSHVLAGSTTKIA